LNNIRMAHLALLVVLVLCFSFALGSNLKIRRPNRNLKEDAVASRRVYSGPPITYHGGPVDLENPINVYLIYYGYWTSSVRLTEKAVLSNFVNGLGTSAWLNVLTLYYLKNTSGTFSPSGTAKLTHSYTYSTQPFGLSLTLTGGEEIVTNALTNSHVPLDPWAFYAVILSPEVSVNGTTCSQIFCSFHSSFEYQPFGKAQNILYALIPYANGSTQNCNNGCVIYVPGPNGASGSIDSMCDDFAHELFEASSDPFGTSWYFNDPNEYEVCDVCENTFLGSSYNSVYHYYWNMEFGTKKYMIQSVFDRETNKCVNAI